MPEKSVVISAVADTTEMAFAQALEQIPSNGTVSEKKVRVTPDSQTIVCEAGNESTAKMLTKSRARQALGPEARVKSVKLKVAGRKGFLGIGAKLNQYEVAITRQAAVEVIYTLPPPDVKTLKANGDIAGLVAALNYQEEDKTRQAALKALSALGHGEDAVKALKQTRDAQALKLLKQAAKDADARVRVAAIQALGAKKDASVRKLLIKARKDEDPDVRKTAVQFLAQTKNARTVEELIAALSDPAPAVSRQAAHSLETMGALAVKPLIAILKHEDKAVCKLAVNMLGKIGDTRAIDALSAALDDADPTARKEVPMALGNIAATARLQGDPTKIMPVANILIRALEKRDAATHHESLTTLQLLSGQDFGDDVERWKKWSMEMAVKAMVAESQPDLGKSVFRW